MHIGQIYKVESHDLMLVAVVGLVHQTDKSKSSTNCMYKYMVLLEATAKQFASGNRQY